MKYISLFLLVFLVLNCDSKTKTSEKSDLGEKAPKQESKGEIIRVDAEKFKALIDKEQVQLIDVRTEEEFEDGHIESAKNINVYHKDFTYQVDKLNKDQPIYVYCRSGKRSMRAAAILKDKGYTIYNLDGGIVGWKEKEYEIIE